MHNPMLPAICTVLALASHALAMDEIGKVTANFDGNDMAWSTLQAAPDETTVTLYDEAMTTQLDLSAHDPSVGLMTNMISIIGIWIKADTVGKPAIEASIGYISDGVNGAFWSSDDAPEPANLTLTEVTRNATGVLVTGQFTAQLCPRASMDAPADLTNCKPISGTFSTQALTE